MRKRSIGKLISLALSATLAFTSVIPAHAADFYPDEDGGEIVVESDEDSAEEEDVGADFDAQEDEEASLDEIDVEEDAEFEAFEDITVTFVEVPSTTTTALYTVAADTITALAPYVNGSTNVDKKINSDYGYSFYVVPKAGYKLPAVPVTLSGSYKTDSDATAVNFSSDDLTISPMTDEEKSLAAAAEAYTGTGDGAKFIWAEGVKVTIKGGENSFLKKYIASETAAASGHDETALKVTAVQATAANYTIPVYKYEKNGTVETFTASGLTSGVELTYNTAINGTKNIYGALTASEWNSGDYTPKFAYVKTVSGVKTIDATLTASVTAASSEANALDDGQAGNYYFATAASAVNVYLDDSIASAGYLNAKSGAAANLELAIILEKSPATTLYPVTAESTEFVNFFYGVVGGDGADKDDGVKYDGTGKRNSSTSVNIKNAAAAATYAAVATTDGKGGRTLTKLFYKIGTNDVAEASFSSPSWTIPAGAGDVVITAETTEGVKFTEVGYYTSNKIVVKTVAEDGTASTDLFATDAAFKTTSVVSGKTLRFTVNPVAGYDIDGVKYTMWNTAGSAQLVNERTIQPDANGIYSISNVTGYVEVDVATKALTDKIGVKLTGATGFKATDYRTKIDLSTSAGFYAEAGKEYKFTVKANDGYKLAATDTVTAKVDVSGTKTDLVVTESAGVYSLTAPSEGTIELTVNVTEMIDVVKVSNPYATVTVNGVSVGDGEKIQLAANKKLTIVATGTNGAEVTAVKYDPVGTKSASSAPANTITEDTENEGNFIIAQATATTYRASNAALYIYVFTSRDAVEGTEFTAKFVDSDTDTEGIDVSGAGTKYTDVSSGIGLYADGGDGTGVVAAINTTNESTVKAVFKIGDASVYSPQVSTTYKTATKTANTADVAAGKAISEQTKVVSDVSVTTGAATLDPQATYSGGTAEYAADTLYAEYTDATPTDDWMNAVVYKASVPVMVYPLNSFYKKTHKNLIVGVSAQTPTTDGLAKDEVRANNSDTITLDVEYDNALATLGTNAAKASTDAEVAAAGIKWAVTPTVSSVAAGAEYQLHNPNKSGGAGADVVSAVTNDTLEISKVTKAQNLTATAEITFVDGTKTKASKVIKAVEDDLGYFAIPTTVVNGIKAVNNTDGTNQTITIETSKANQTSVNTASLSYTVYHALDATGVTYLRNTAELAAGGGKTTEEFIALAIEDGHIEAVDPGKVTWTALTGTAANYADYYTIGGSNGAYTLTAKAKTSTDTLKLDAKVGSYSVVTPTQVSVVVNVETARHIVKFLTGDSSAATDYKHPALSERFKSTLGYKVEEVLSDVYKGDIDGYNLTDIAEGTILVLPSVEAFDGTTIDPERSLAGWAIGTVSGSTFTADSYAKADGTFQTSAITADTVVVKAIWAPKYSATTNAAGIALPANGSVAIVNSAKEAIVSGNIDMAIGTTLPITIGYYALDPSKAPTASNIFYDADLTILDPSVIASNLKVTSISSEAAKFVTTSATESGTTTYTFTDNTLTPKTEATLARISVSVEWKDKGVTTYGDATRVIAPLGVGIVAANEWEFAMDPIEVEVGQAKTLAFKTFKLNGTATNLGVTGNFTGTPEFESASEDIVTVVAGTAADNEFEFRGIAAGTTTATFSFTDAYGTDKSFTVPVTVKPAAYSIVAEYTPAATLNELVAPKATALGANEVAHLPIGAASALSLSISNADDFDGTVTFTVADKDLAYEEDTTGLTDANIAIGSGSTPNPTVTPSALGRAYMLVTMSVTPSGASSALKYERVICVESYGLVKVYGPVSGNTLIPADTSVTPNIVATTEDKAFKINTKNASAPVITKDKFAIIPVYYDPAVKVASGKYTITGLTDYTPEWIDTQITQQFYGWGSATLGAAQTSAVTVDKAVINTTSAVDAYVGTTLKLTATQVTAGDSLFAYFKTTDLTLNGGYNKSIDLSDEEQTTNGADQTYAGKIEVNVLPRISKSNVTVYADKADIINIAQTGIANAAYGATTWNGASAVTLAQSTPTGSDYRVDSFEIAKATGKVGVATLSLVANGEVLDTITVNANGEYTDTGKTYYMYRGENIKNSNAVVNGKTHYYDEDGVLVTGKAYYVEDEKAWVLLASTTGDQITTKGVNVLDGKSYYIDADGFVLTGLFNGLITSGTKKDTDKTYYADPETAALTVFDIAKADDGITRFFDKNGYMVKASSSADEYEAIAGTDYYVNADGAVALGGIFKVDGKDRLFRESGKIVSYTDSDVVNGKIEVGGMVYVINKDTNEAEADHEHKWSIKWADWKVTDTTAKATITCSVGGETVDLEGYVERTTAASGIVKATVSITYAGETWTDSKAGQVSGDKVIEVVDISGGEYGFVITGLAEEYDYTGNAIQPRFSVVDMDLDGGTTLAKGVDYTVKFKNNKNIGVAEVTITGKGNYSGQSQTANFKIVDPFEDVQDDDAILKGATVKVSKDTLYYNGEAQYPSYIEIKLKGASGFTKYELTDGQNSEVPAVITYSNNVNKGTATICLTGKKDDKGKVTTIKKTFSIKAVNMKANASKFTVTVDEKTPWAVKGATPSVSVTYNETGEVLLAGEDFTVKYNNNKKVGTAATVSITGKNNFTGTIKDAKAFEIEKFDLADADFQGATVYDGVKGGAVKVTLGDAKEDFIAGGKLKVTVLKGETDMAKTKLVAGDEVTVKVEPKANSAELTGSIEKTFTVGANLAKATIKITTKNYSKQYTGEAITLDEEDMKNFTATIKIGKETKTLVYGEDFVIGGYNNNIKKGTMQVTFIGTEQADEERGIPAISGAKTVKVKISAKPMQKAR